MEALGQDEPVSTVRGLQRMRPRDPEDRSRGASGLDLFFDLVFVIAVSVMSAQLGGLEESGRLAAAASAYLLAFVTVWWAWVNFTWFASAFDTDDWLYRLVTVVQMAGVLVLASGVPAAMHEADWRLATVGYVVMRLAMVSQWLRAAVDDRATRATAVRYAVGITAVQILWVLRLLLSPGPLFVSGFFALLALELLVPVWAERAHGTPFNRSHIAERYRLFTLILLGEGLLGVATSIFSALQEHHELTKLLVTAASALVIVAGMWWIYFSRDQDEQLRSFRSAFAFSQLHYVIFAAAGAVAAGIEVAVQAVEDPESLRGPVAAACTTVPLAVFLLGVWLAVLRTALPRWTSAVLLVLVVATGFTALAPVPLATAAVLTAGIVAVLEFVGLRRCPKSEDYLG